MAPPPKPGSAEYNRLARVAATQQETARNERNARRAAQSRASTAATLSAASTGFRNFTTGTPPGAETDAQGIARRKREKEARAAALTPPLPVSKFDSKAFGKLKQQQAASTPTAAETPQKKKVKEAAASATPPKDVKPNFPKPSTDSLPPGLEGAANKENRIQTTGTAQTQVFNINSFLTEVINNDVLPSHSYLVTFSPFRAGYDENVPLTKFVTNKRSNLIMRCESIILPTPSLLEEENIRRYGYGPVEKVPYGVQFSDVSMTWLVDSNSEIIDFMHQWINTIVMHDSPGANMSQSSEKRGGLEGYRPFEVGYKDGYTNPIVRVYVYNRQLQTVTEYEMFDVFPMNIQSLNLAWSDENQVQKLTVNFAYTNMRVRAPRIVKDQDAYNNLEALVSPYEERRQPSDKGGAAAADAAGSPNGELLQSTANASTPNATESKQTAPTSVVVSPNSPQNRVLGP